jgi:murein DD-endopeptidase MepM/ murein hydrolase activator NlpD
VEPVPVLAVSQEDPAVTREGTLRRGESLFAALRGKGYPAGTLFEILEELKPLIDPRRLSPGDGYRLTLRSGLIETLELIRDEATYIVEKDSTGFNGRVEAFPVETVVRKVSGTVTSSLYEAIVENGGHPALVVAVSDLMQWDIDFFTDPRRGDRFSILVEEYRRGAEFVGYGQVLFASYDGERARRDAAYYADASGHSDHYDAQGQSLRKAFLKSPLNYRRISSRFTYHRLHPILKTVRAHLGVDYAAPTGTPVVTIGSGQVTYCGWKGGFGRLVEVRHNGAYTTAYAHLSGFGAGVRRGARVSQGQVVGYVGASGLATGPHLDFRVKHAGSFVDPLGLKSPPAEPIAAEYASSYHEYRDRLMRADSELAALDGMPSDQFLSRFFSEALTAEAFAPVAAP